MRRSGTKVAHALLREHFPDVAPDEIVTTVRSFPARMRADLQTAIDNLFGDDDCVRGVVGLHKRGWHETLDFPKLCEPGQHAIMVGPLQYEEIDIGDDQPVRCLKNALWLLERDGLRHAMVLSEAIDMMDHARQTHIEIAAPAGSEAETLASRYFNVLEEAVAMAGCYRGKVLSLESRRSYSGRASGILVHKLRSVDREQVILPQSTLDLLERNVFEFFARRDDLARLGMSVKKGLLFYGPPGTGKTHSVHYLASRLKDHTTLLVTAEQMGILPDYMSLARLLQPSILVIEDADLIARDRMQMGSACEEVLLNQLLNEMDGLREDAEILFILTTNRPDSLEAALASRPGRIDQAIEFPLPDDEGRKKLVQLYAGDVTIPGKVLQKIIKRTDLVSASFIKELMRRAAQFCLSRDAGPTLDPSDVEQALDELLISGGRLNAALLGAASNATSP